MNNELVLFAKHLAFASLAAGTLAVVSAGCAESPRTPEQVGAADHQRVVDELASATDVVDTMREIPSNLRQRARCVVVVPSLVRGGFIVGARHGDGIVTCRTTAGWSGPVFFSVNGGSAGLQIGVESSDVVLLVMSERGMTQLFRTSFALGADVSAAVGPVGEAAQAGTDATLTAEIFSYARSRGLFAGAELGGTVLKQDPGAQAALYGASADAHAILAGQVAAPAEASRFLSLVATAFAATPS